MSTPDEECILRDAAIAQIIEQIKAEFDREQKPHPSEDALLIMAKERHDNPNRQFRP